MEAVGLASCPFPEADMGARGSSIAGVLPMAAGVVTAILVGSAMVATRFVIDQTHPVSLALWRYLIGFCCLLPPVLLSPRVRFERRDLLPIGLLGITQFGILIALLNYALQFIPSARAALIFATLPLLTMILAVGPRSGKPHPGKDPGCPRDHHRGGVRAWGKGGSMGWRSPSVGR